MVICLTSIFVIAVSCSCDCGCGNVSLTAIRCNAPSMMVLFVKINDIKCSCDALSIKHIWCWSVNGSLQVGHLGEDGVELGKDL